MQFEIGDEVIWREDESSPGVIEAVSEKLIAVRWQRAGLLTYNASYWHSLTPIKKNKVDFNVVEVVKTEDFTGTVVVYKGRKYKLSLVK